MRGALLALMLVSAPAAAFGGSIGGVGGSSSASTLSAGALMDATNTLCSQTLSLAWSGDTNTGFQYISADRAQWCFGGTSLFSGYNTAALGSGLSLSGTSPTTPTATYVAFTLTATTAGAEAFSQRGISLTLDSGYTGSSSTTGIRVNEQVAGTGATALGAGAANYGIESIGAQTTAGHQVGAKGTAGGGNLSVGLVGRAVSSDKDSAVYVGVAGQARNTGATPVNVGGYFELNSAASEAAMTAPTLADTAALIADNRDVADDIFIARDNGGTTAFKVANGAQTTIVGTVGNPFEYCVSTTNCGAQGTNSRVIFSIGDSNNTGNLLVMNGAADRVQIQADSVNRWGEVFALNTQTGDNLQVYSAANAAGEIAVTSGTNDTSTAVTLHQWVTDIDGTKVPKYAIQGNGHRTSTGVVPSDYTTGTCTSETGTGDDTHGTLTATCTAQTLIVTFGGTWGTAPVCVISAMNAAAAAGAATLTYTVSTTVLTMTVTTATTAGTWAYQCEE